MQKCEMCSERFEPKTPWTRFCSTDCRVTHSKLRTFATVKIAAERLGLPVETIRYKAAKGELPSFKLFGRLYIILREPKPVRPKKEFGMGACANCSAEFKLTSYHGRFCSKPCRIKFGNDKKHRKFLERGGPAPTTAH